MSGLEVRRPSEIYVYVLLCGLLELCNVKWKQHMKLTWRRMTVDISLAPYAAGGGVTEEMSPSRAEVVHEGGRSARQLLAQVEPRAAGLVLHLERAVVGLVGGARVGAHHVAETELGVRPEPRVVGQEVGAAAGAEQAVAQHEGALVARVPVGRDRLRCHH